MAITVTVVGSYPKPPHEGGEFRLRKVLQALDHGEASLVDVHAAEDDLVREVLAEQAAAGVGLVTDGQVRWDDGQTRLAEGLEGFVTSGLLRYFDTNTYFRQPVVKDRVHRRGPILLEELLFAKEHSPVPVKAVLTGASTLAALSIDEHYRDHGTFVLAIASIIRPEYLGLAAETNLIRLIAPPTVYASLKQMVNAAAADLQLAAATAKRYVSVQVDVAWGWGQSANTYVGVEQDFADFPFMQALGLSSYPYFVYADPDQVPLDYYSRLPNGRTLPVMIVEGGWTSASAGTIVSSPEKQVRYVRRQARMLDSARAKAVFQLTFTDLDVQSGAFPPSVAPFAFLGLVDTELRPKAVLSVWDSLFAIRRN